MVHHPIVPPTPSSRRPALLLAVAALSLLPLTLSACGEEPTATPLSLRSPSRFVYAPQCVVDGKWLALRDCPDPVLVDDRAFVTNIETASLAFVDIAGGGASLVDTSDAVPGITPVRIGERPQAVVATDDGAFVLTVNAITRDLSLVEVARQRELTSFPTDEIGTALALDPTTGEIWVGYASGRLELRQLGFDCGAGANVYTTGCELSPQDVTLDIVDVLQAPGAVQAMRVDPTRPRLYVAYADQLFVSAFALEGSDETCLESATGARCEVARLAGAFGCADGLDNDGDGFADAQDPQCYSRSGAESPDGTGYFTTTACSDGNDNDGDGLIDMLDPGCVSLNDASEDDGAQPLEPTACTDGLDNDGDGLTDNRDPDCLSPDDGDESGRALLAACSDGIDNDGDGLTDFPEDPGCAAPDDDTEDDTAACSDGLDNDGDGLTDFPADPGCASRTDVSEARAPTACSDGLDNDGDGRVDLADAGCYGASGATEKEVARIGLGPLGVDPRGRWLYVIDRSEWQLLVIDLEQSSLINAGARNPYTTVPGIRVNPVPQAVAGDIRTSTLVETGTGARIERDEAVAYVATTAGTLDVVSIHQTFRRIESDAVTDTAETFTLRVGDTAGNASASASNVRCIGRVCDPAVLPEVTLRQRPTVLVTEGGEVITSDPDTGAPVTTSADEIFVDEAWQLTYEGVLPGSERTDGVLVADGQLTFGGNFCALGVRPGDRVLITSPVGGPVEDLTCLALSEFRATQGLAPEWEVVAVRTDALELAVIEDDDSELPTVDVLPTRRCYPFGLAFEVRPDDQWIANAEVTSSLLRLESRDGVCVDPVVDPLGDGRIETGVPFTNGLFALTIPESFPVARGATVQFSVRSGYAPLRRSLGPLPGDVAIVQTPERKFIFVPDEGADQLFLFDADRLSSLESL